MLGHEPEQRCRRYLPPLDDAEFDQRGQHPGGLCLAHPGELGDRPQVQLGRGLGQDGQDPALGARHDRLDRSDEVHRRLCPDSDYRTFFHIVCIRIWDAARAPSSLAADTAQLHRPAAVA